MILTPILIFFASLFAVVGDLTDGRDPVQPPPPPAVVDLAVEDDGTLEQTCKGSGADRECLVCIHYDGGKDCWWIKKPETNSGAPVVPLDGFATEQPGGDPDPFGRVKTSFPAAPQEDGETTVIGGLRGR